VAAGRYCNYGLYKGSKRMSPMCFTSVEEVKRALLKAVSIVRRPCVAMFVLVLEAVSRSIV
jgi:hypothetical protein